MRSGEVSSFWEAISAKGYRFGGNLPLTRFGESVAPIRRESVFSGAANTDNDCESGNSVAVAWEG